LSAPSQLPMLASTDGGASWLTLDPPGEPGFTSYDLDHELLRQALVPGAVLRGTRRGDLWAYGLFPPCAIQPVLGFGRVWAQHPELRQAAGCPLGPEQAVALETRHVDTPSEHYDLYWAADATVPCVQVFDHGDGQLTGGPVEPFEAAGCNGSAEQPRSGSLLSFPNGQFWLFIADPNGRGLVVTSLGSAWTQPVIHL